MSSSIAGDRWLRAGRWLWRCRSGALLWLVLAIMAAAMVTGQWFILAGMVGAGCYLELVHVRHVLQRLLALVDPSPCAPPNRRTDSTT